MDTSISTNILFSLLSILIFLHITFIIVVIACAIALTKKIGVILEKAKHHVDAVGQDIESLRQRFQGAASVAKYVGTWLMPKSKKSKE